MTSEDPEHVVASEVAKETNFVQKKIPFLFFHFPPTFHWRGVGGD